MNVTQEKTKAYSKAEYYDATCLMFPDKKEQCNAHLILVEEEILTPWNGKFETPHVFKHQVHRKVPPQSDWILKITCSALQIIRLEDPSIVAVDPS